MPRFRARLPGMQGAGIVKDRSIIIRHKGKTVPGCARLLYKT